MAEKTGNLLAAREARSKISRSMRPAYGRSYWIDQFPRSRVPSYPKHTGSHELDVAIIGGGLTGCATAYAFAAAGVKVALFEAGRIGRAETGLSSGWVTDEPSVPFASLDKAVGRRFARHAYQSWRRAALDFQALVRRLDIKCHLDPRPSLVVAQTPEQAAQLTREHKVRRDAGLDSTLLPAKSISGLTGFPASAAVRTKEAAVVDPYRATVGLAAAAVARGADIFERSLITKTTFTRDRASLHIGTAAIPAKRIIVCTGDIGALFKPLARHLARRTTYTVLTEPIPARIRRSLGSSEYLIRDSSDPPHRVSWLGEDRLLVSGADSAPVSARARDAMLVQRTGQLMYELSTFYPDISGLQPAFSWDVDYTVTASGLPIIGAHRNYPFHLFASGERLSLTAAFLASRILLRQHLDEVQPADHVFGFAR